jgi:hypothetical protein
MFTIDLYDPEKRRHALDVLAATRPDATTYSPNQSNRSLS